MKKAFDANVSRAKPRVRLGALMTADNNLSAETVESLAQQVAHEAPPVIPSVDSMDLGSALRMRAQARANRSSAAEALQEAIAAPARDEVQARATTWAAPVHEMAAAPVVEQVV